MISPELIRANILLAQGERSEARRLLGLHLKQHKPENLHDDPFVLWLDAQTRSERNERVQQLRLLVATAPIDNPYALLAKDALTIEDALVTPTARRTRGGLIFSLILGAIAIIGVLILILNSFFSAPTPIALVATEMTAEATDVLVATDLPIVLTGLPPETHQAEYTEGILQVTAIEDNSNRVFDRFTGQQIEPINGARFFVVYVVFECRVGICQEPPQATLTLLQTDGFTFVPRNDVVVADVPLLEPVALGISTVGAVVFEIPFVGLPSDLEISPLGDKGDSTLISLLK